MCNNLIPKPDTILAVQKYYSSFERERSLSNFACTVNKTAHVAHCHFDLRLRYWTLWTRISVKVIPYGAVARRSQRVIDSIYFGMYRITHLERFLSFGFPAFQFQYRYAYSRGKNSKM
ncbi:hypothetical protein ALC60_02935 [Trachymyrmex zeteki]|uniref:Uncharacterized protein n=1 Tax=Mycetomoellerius zeteki TaxID=64791 RepID=A0A151XBX3_9HYME|nr:hypothetical protein ALC60_02935 [Trachymyrmex zeteki]